MNISTDDKNIASDEQYRKMMYLQRQRYLNSEQMPVTVGFEICHEWALMHIKTQHAAALEIESGGYTPAERDTWPVQFQAAKDFLAGNADEADERMLDRLCRDGETKEALCHKIIGKHAAGKELIGIAGETKRAAEDAVNAAATVGEVRAAMAAAGEQMKAAITAFKQQMAVASSS